MNNSQGGHSFAPASSIARILAIGWVTGLALLYLVRYDGWLAPVQCAQVLWSALPTLRFGPHFAEFARGRFADLGCVAALLATAFAVGATVTGRWSPRRDRLGALVALAMGLWLTAVAVLVLGALTTSLVRWVYAGAACWLLPAPRSFIRRFANPPQPAERLDGWTRFLLVCFVVAAVLNLVGAMVPPFEYDELEYHLGAPAEYLRAGRIVFLPNNFYSNLPQLTEMLYLAAMTTSSDIAAKLLHWVLGVLSAVTVYEVAGRLWSRRVAVMSVAFFYCGVFVQDLSATARIDLATTFFATLAFGCLLVWQQERTPAVERCVGPENLRTMVAKAWWSSPWLWFSAAMLGMAVATKWTAAAVLVLPAFVFLVVATKSFRLSSVFCLLSFAFVVPWLVKNWLLAGNPVYPLLTNVWPSPHWSPAQAALFAEKHYPSFDMTGWLQLGERLWQYSFLEMNAGPLLLMTAPLILLARRVDAATRRVGLLFVAAYASWWLLTFRPWRFLFPSFPLAAMVAGCALYAFEGEQRWVRWVMRGAVGLVLGIGLSVMAFTLLIDAEKLARVPPQMSRVQYVLGCVGRDEFMARMGGGLFDPIIWMNHNLPVNAKVLYIGEARIALAQRAVVWATAFDQHPLAAAAARARDAEDLWRSLRASGVTDVYVNFSELERLGGHYGYLQNANWYLIRNMLQQYASEIHRTRRGAVFELQR